MQNNDLSTNDKRGKVRNHICIVEMVYELPVSFPHALQDEVNYFAYSRFIT